MGKPEDEMNRAIGPGEFLVGCDVGGTFTDIVALVPGTAEAISMKLLTTNIEGTSSAIVGGIRELLDSYLAEVADSAHAGTAERVVHATTLFSNAVVERSGSRVGLITTDGFRDVLEQRRHLRVDEFDLRIKPPEPLVPRRDRLTVDERVLADGRELRPLSCKDVELAAEVFKNEQVNTIAIVFLHSYVNAEHEQRARDLVGQSMPGVPVSISSEVLAKSGEYERASTSVINAYLQPLAANYLADLEISLCRRELSNRLVVFSSAGGVMSAKTAIEFPVRFVESGPAAGAVMAARIGKETGRDVLSFDMGGTTAKACMIIDGEVPLADELEVARAERFLKGSGLPIGIPSIALIEIGAGGGSLATINAVGVVQVGPKSAGANPGPACYQHGGIAPTVTDADVVLGYLPTDGLAGGKIPLSYDAAWNSLAALSAALKLDVTESAHRVEEVVTANMATAARLHAIERGVALEEMLMVAFGGAGPVHADMLARQLKVPEIFVPPLAGVGSAMGLVYAPPQYERSLTYNRSLVNLDTCALEEQFRVLSGEITARLREVDDTNGVAIRRFIACRYVNQGHAIRIEVTGKDITSADVIRKEWEAEYLTRYGRNNADCEVEIKDLLVVGRVLVDVSACRPRDLGATSSRGGEHSRDAFSSVCGEMVRFRVYERQNLHPETPIDGPCIVEEAQTSIIVDAGAVVEVDRGGAVRIRIEDF